MQSHFMWALRPKAGPLVVDWETKTYIKYFVIIFKSKIYHYLKMGILLKRQLGNCLN